MDKQVVYRTWKFEVDFDRTKAVYDLVEKGGPESCACDACENFSANREKIYPAEVKYLLMELGVDYRKEAEICHYGKLDNGKHFYGGWFHFKGRIIEGKDCTVITLNGGRTIDTITINEDFQIGFMIGSDLSFFDNDESEDLIQIEFLANADWVIDKALESE